MSQNGAPQESLVGKAFALLQKVGKALMLPVSVLPVAGILLGVGAADLAWIHADVRAVMKAGGGAVFTMLPLFFAIGVALGLADNDGVAALAATVGFGVMTATMGVFRFQGNAALKSSERRSRGTSACTVSMILSSTDGSKGPGRS